MSGRPTTTAAARGVRQSLLTARDEAIVDTTVRLGAVTAATLQALHAPGIRADTFRARLQVLHRHGHLRRTRHLAPGRVLWLYTPGPAALTPGEPRPWQPSINQLGHTLAVGETLTHLLRPGTLGSLQVISWQGEAELRAWEQAGHPRPDLRITWTSPTTGPGDGETTRPAAGRVDIEVDQGTEARAAWQRKLARYLTFTPNARVLIVTINDTRARHIATYARQAGIAAFTTTQQLLGQGLPLGYDAASGRRLTLEQALVPTGRPPT